MRRYDPELARRRLGDGHRANGVDRADLRLVVPLELRRKMVELAGFDNVTLSEAVRRAIRDYLHARGRLK